MALNIKDPGADQLARRLAALTGESITVAVKTAVRQCIEREERERGKASVEELMAIAKRIASRIDRDGRTADEIIGYAERGLPNDGGRYLGYFGGPLAGIGTGYYRHCIRAAA